MTKEQFVELLKELDISINEGIQNDINKDVYPRIVFWEFGWDDVRSSGSNYDTNVTYQVSFFSIIPRDPKIIELKHKLNELNKMPFINMEYIEEERYWHYYFSIDLLENI